MKALAAFQIKLKKKFKKFILPLNEGIQTERVKIWLKINKFDSIVQFHMYLQKYIKTSRTTSAKYIKKLLES